MQLKYGSYAFDIALGGDGHSLRQGVLARRSGGVRAGATDGHDFDELIRTCPASAIEMHENLQVEAEAVG